MAPIDSYKQHAADQLRLYRGLLLDGQSSGFLRALAFRAWQIMNTQLQSPASVLVYEKMGAEPKYGLRGADRWQLSCQDQAGAELSPGSFTASADQWLMKMSDYVDFRKQLQASVPVQIKYTADKFNGVGYLQTPSPELPKVMDLVAKELVAWSVAQPFDQAFATKPVSQGYIDFLWERKDLISMIRVAQALPGDVEKFSIEVEVPTAVQDVEMLIGLIPCVGNVVAAYEVYTGQNLFGYHLSGVERGILAAAIFIPIAGRFFKASRAVYTEARLVRLYGRDAASWSRTIQASERVAANPKAFQILSDAEQELHISGQVDATLLQDATKALAALQGSVAPSTAVEQSVVDLFRTVSSNYPALQTLDEFALRRILLKGPNLSHMKGQLVEEMLETQVVPWLADRTGSFAFGLELPAGKKLEFVPGHLLRDLKSRQITDGILGYRDNGAFKILAIFEAKAGPKAARELSVARSSVSSLTDDEKLELAGAIEDEFLDLQDVARQAGVPLNKTRDQVAAEYLQTERGGQIARDRERLSPGVAGAPVEVFMGRERIAVDFSPTKTKFFGVIPQGLKASQVAQIKAELTAENVQFEIVAVSLTAKDADKAAADLLPLAKLVLTGKAP